MRRETARMQRCPTSTGSRNIIGQAPGMTAMPWSRQRATADSETLPGPMPWCIHTRGMPSAAQSSTRAAVASGGVTITTPSSEAGTTLSVG